MSDLLRTRYFCNGCVVRIDVPLDMAVKAESYSGPGVVYDLAITIPTNGAAPQVAGHILKFKKDGTVGRQSSSIDYGSLSWSQLPQEIRDAAADAYAKWLARIPQSLPLVSSVVG